jgi:hypothetical protein
VGAGSGATVSAHCAAAACAAMWRGGARPPFYAARCASRPSNSLSAPHNSRRDGVARSSPAPQLTRPAPSPAPPPGTMSSGRARMSGCRSDGCQRARRRSRRTRRPRSCPSVWGPAGAGGPWGLQWMEACCAPTASASEPPKPAAPRVVYVLYQTRRRPTRRPHLPAQTRPVASYPPTRYPNPSRPHPPPRSCIGRYFAVLEAQVLLARLLRRVTFAAAPGQPPMSLVQQLTLASAAGIPVVPLARE